jgi:hypothetical protein
MTQSSGQNIDSNMVYMVFVLLNGLVIVVGGGVDVGCFVVDGVAIVVSPLVVGLVVEGRGVVVPLQIKLFHYFVQ